MSKVESVNSVSTFDKQPEEHVREFLGWQGVCLTEADFIDCESDPRIWSQVEAPVRSQFVPATQLQPIEVAVQPEK